MKVIVSLLKLIQNKYTNPYRIITGIGFIAMTAMVLASPLKLLDPDDWINYVGTKHFSEGRLTVDYKTITKDVMEVGIYKGVLIHYMPLENGMWALEKAPGYLFYLVPFFKLGISRFGNVLMALSITIAVYLLLKRIRDEKTAMIGSLLMLYNPISLVMLNRVFMDTYFSTAMLVIGSCLYYYLYLEKDNMSARKKGILLFFAFLFISWSVVARYSNILIAVALTFHYAIVKFKAWQKKDSIFAKTELIPVILVIGIPLTALLVYNHSVFGSPFTTGYSLSPYPIKFAFQYIGQVDIFGKSIPGQILLNNTEAYAFNTIFGFPVMLVGIPAFIIILYKKITSHFKHSTINRDMVRH